MKKSFWIITGLLLFSLLQCIETKNFQFTDKSIQHTFYDNHGDIELIFENYLKDFCAIEPGLNFNFGKPEKPVYYFSPATLESEKQAESLSRHYLKELKKVDLKRLDKIQRINYDIFKDRLMRDVEGKKYLNNSYTFSHIFGFPSTIISQFEIYQITNQEEAEAYVSCMQQVSYRMTQYLEFADMIEKRKVYTPVHSAMRLLRIMKEINKQSPEDFTIYVHFKEGINHLNISDEMKDKLDKEALNITCTKIKPSFTEFEKYLESYIGRCPGDNGLWAYPNGEEQYRFALRNHSGTNYSPEYVHALGLSEVSRITKEMMQLIHQLGLSNKDDFKACYKDYKTYVDTCQALFINGTNNQQVIDKYNDIIKDAEKRLPEFFTQLPKSKVEVREAPVWSGSGNYYDSPVADRSKNGIFYTRVYPNTFIPAMKTLCYHETIPGHHLQIAIALESDANRKCNTLSFSTGFVEGWALYAERLARENHFFSTPYEQLENLDSELYRAIRLVVDTGLHYKRWSREQASQYFLTFWDWNGLSEIDRYLVWPGQACSYKIGELKLIELRQKYKKKKGDLFDIREFHRLVLENGSLPLHLLESKILSE